MIIDLEKEKISLSMALEKANPHDIILLENKTYHEKITLNKPYITLKGKENSIIEFDACHKKIIPLELDGDGAKKYGTTGSSTFRLLPKAHDFICYNVTFLNSHPKYIHEKGAQAVSFKTEADNTRLYNCKIISYQDTFYVDDCKNNLFYNCYILGDIDFIFGSGEALFQNCVIENVKDKVYGYFTASSTYIDYEYGLTFNECKFISNMYSPLGRRWYPGGATKPIYPRECFINCNFIGNILLEYVPMNENDPYEGDMLFNNCIHNDIKIKNDNIDKYYDFIKTILNKYKGEYI